MKTRLIPFLYLLLLIAAAPLPVRAQSACQLCAPGAVVAAPSAARALRIEIDAMLDFSTAAHTQSGEGSIEIDPRTGQRRVTGGLVGLGGMALKGTVRLSGEPFRHVRITLPGGITMQSTMGATAYVEKITADISADPVLGSDGTLVFSFGGRMIVNGGAAGEFHGRIPITAEYQ
jgi:Domain of unknown function (DUF4402)